MEYTPEISLLSLLLKKDNYNKYYNLLDIKELKDTHRELWHIYSALNELHEKNDNDLTIPDLQAYFFVRYPAADKAVYSGLFSDLFKQTVSDETGIAILSDIEKRKAALKLSEIAYQVSTGNKDISAAQEYIDVLQGKQSATPLDLTPLETDLETLVQEVYQKPGLRWRLNCLNKSLGSLRAGDFGFIFARPETGKTTFLASEVSNFLTQTDQNVAWLNNEEDGKKVLLRVYQAFFGCTLEQLLANVKRYQGEFQEATGGRFKFFDSATISKATVERICQEYEPRLVIYDQIDKIKGFAADREDLRLGAIYQWGRELAKNRHSVIAVCQAAGAAENVKWLNMDHVANALTAKQAEADYIIGIGKIHDIGSEYVRFLNLPKNKLMQDSDSDPKLRHGKFEVMLQPDLARYKDIIDYGRKV